MIGDGARFALALTKRALAIMAGSLVLGLAMFAIATVVVRHELAGERRATAAPHVGSPVVYTSRDGYRHAALLIGTADGEHWNLSIWTSGGEIFTRFGVVEGQPSVPNSWHVVGVR
ncbi:MAG: hypothetical protein ACF8XB_09810 [Planctomycetota bacterium JB042]